MKRIPVIIAVLVIFSCASTEKKNAGEPIQPGSTAETKNQARAGWADSDTYTVHVSAENLDEAIRQAHHQILKDIVNVRMLNNSRYTDITMIQEEFKEPLKNGRVIDPAKTADGIEIWFQIHDDGLREKFERK